MSNEQSKIEWTDFTFNPVIGCTHVSPGCINCYAEHNRFATTHGIRWGAGEERYVTSDNNWLKPLNWNRKAADLFCECQSCGDRMFYNPGDDICLKCGGADVRHATPRVFCASLSDWLDPEWDDAVLTNMLDLVRCTPNIDWLLLSKRIDVWMERMTAAYGYSDNILKKWIDQWFSGTPPDNVWMGTSVEDQRRADERVPMLLDIPARIRFLSVEPMLENIKFTGPAAIHDFMCDSWDGIQCDCGDKRPKIHWVICGGESGPKKRNFAVGWGRDLKEQCKRAGVPFFFKQVDKVQPIPVDLQIRQFPETIKRVTTPCKAEENLFLDL